MSIHERLEAGIIDQGDTHTRKRKREAVMELMAADDVANEPKMDRKKKRKEKDEEQEKTDKKSKRHKKDAHTPEVSNTNKPARRKSHSESEGPILEIKQKKKSKQKKTDTGEGPRSAEKTILDADLVQESGQNSEAATLSEMSKHKKRRKLVEPAGDVESTKKSKHKKNHTLDEVVAETSVQDAASAVADDGASRKKRKKRKHEEAGEAHVEISEKSEPSPSHKKKKTRLAQKHSEFPDPSEDTALSESARNALVYVYARVTSSQDWKFNKARQNWVLRNIWDDAAIPETYIPSCMKYLAEVQGNTRKLLITSSRQLIEAPSEQEAATTASAAAVAQPEAQKIDATDAPEEQQRKQTLKAARARTLLSVLGEAMDSAS